MPRWPFRRKSAPLVAAAEQLQPGHRRAQKRLRQPWQHDAEFFSANLGAVRFASGVRADACSRCDLVMEKLVEPESDTWEPVESNLLADMLRRYKGPSETQRELVRQHAWLTDTVGECLQIVEQGDNGMSFSLRSPLATVWQHGGVLVRDVPGGTSRDGTARVVPYEQTRRIWIPNETWPGLATSPLAAVIEDCKRYWTMGRRMRREAESALVGNGVVWTPREAHTDLARVQSEPGGPSRPGTDLERDYYSMAARAFDEDESIEGIAPMMWSWSHEYGPPQYLNLKSDLSKEALDYRTEALESIARGLNYPQRLLVDGGDSTNHWGAWLLQETFVKEAVAPGMERICWGDLTVTFARPALRAMAAKGLFHDNPDDYRVGFDVTPIVVHPDQSAQAIELYKIGVLSDTELLTVTGFDETAMPTREEMGRWILRTQIQRETVRAPLPPGQSMPSDASTVLEQVPAGPPGMALPGPTVGALEVASTVRPFPSEELGWLT